MEILPDASAFTARYDAGAAQLVWTTLVGDLETPVSAFLKIAGGKPNAFLFESVEGGAVRGRYSIIGLDPDIIWRTKGTRAEINRNALNDVNAFEPCKEPPLEALRALVAESKLEVPNALPPMAAGIFGYLGYDMVRLMEKLPAPNPDALGITDAILIRPTVIVVFDAVKDAITVITPVRPAKGVPAKAAHARATERLSAIVDALEKPLPSEESVVDFDPLKIATTSNTTPAEYEKMVLAAKE
jgi:anthranilate synthase component 1